MRGILTFAALTFFASSPLASAGQTCQQQIAQTENILTGMFIRQPDQVTEINGFPLFGSDQGIAYLNCPVIAVDGTEATSCGIGILEPQGEVLQPVEQFGIKGCADGDTQAEDCPDFTAEGFSANNGRQLAEIVKRDQDQICARFGTQPVVTLTSVASPSETVPGLDGRGFFEIMPDCTALGAGAGCAAIVSAAQSEVAGLIWITASNDRMACAVALSGALLACGMSDRD